MREVIAHAKSVPVHDYLSSPEIVEDIARCYEGPGDLQSRFVAATKPCIVKFRNPRFEVGAIRSAIWYVFSKLRDNKVTSNSAWAFVGEGMRVPPEAIVNVEVIAAQ